MNQTELNTIGKLFIKSQSIEVTNSLLRTLNEDIQERVKKIPVSAVHHVHNMALFYTLLNVNFLYKAIDDSDEASEEYLEHAETFKTQFLDIVEALKDFEPKDKGNTPTN